MDSPPRALRADAERNRRRILDAARATFAERGLEVGLDAIAQTAGVGVGTVYRRFATKDDLLRAIFEDWVSDFMTRLEPLEAIEDPWEAFAAATELFAGAVAEDRGFFQLLASSLDPMPGEEHKLRVLDGLDRFLRRAQAAGVVRGDVVVLDVAALCAAAARKPARRAMRQPELWRRHVAIVLDGLRVAGAHELRQPPPLPLDLPASLQRPRAGESCED